MIPVTPPRPQPHDKPVLRRAAELLAQALAEALPDLGENDEHMVGVLADVLHHHDAYDMARSLDSFGWDVDFDLVLALNDNADECKGQALGEAVGLWVKAYQVAPKFNPGDQVTFTRRGVETMGYIYKVEPRLAEYTVLVMQNKPMPIIPFEAARVPEEQAA
jgi:hypothetical protein